MIKIEKPSFTVSEVLIDCIANMQNTLLKDELTKSKLIFNIAEYDFDKKKKTNSLYQIKQNIVISNNIDSKVLKKLYKDRMQKKGNIGRKYYELILNSSKKGKCPFCNIREVKTLDHYLPKAKYPLLSITPTNLIPCCSDCNKDKLDESPTVCEDETLHPYYDDITQFEWLKTRLINIKPLELEYYISPTIPCNALLKLRIQNHFFTYKLNELYSIHALEEFENIFKQISDLFKNTNKHELKKHLKDCYKSRYQNNKNSWQTAFYECIYKSNDFCDGKFL